MGTRHLWLGIQWVARPSFGGLLLQLLEQLSNTFYKELLNLARLLKVEPATVAKPLLKSVSNVCIGLLSNCGEQRTRLLG